MANDNYITHFTAKDIERYHKGQLSAQQMHALEKAALDDPFLADALEGYAVPGVNVSADLSELQNRLSEKVEGAKVIPLQTAPRRSFRALRVAVMILFVAGAGLLVYKLGFDKKTNNAIVQTNPADKPGGNNNVTDTTKNPSGYVENGSGPVTKNIQADSKDVAGKNEQESVNEGRAETVSEEKTTGSTVVPGKISTGNTDDIAVNKPATTTIPQPGTVNPVKAAEEKENTEKYKKEIAKSDVSKERNLADKYEGETVAGFAKDNQQNNRNMTTSRRAENATFYNNTNTFRGRVVDADNNGVPFANVTNVQDKNAGTFTDAKGYFNLTYPDSVLNVQVRSIGFENNSVQLRNSLPNNQVVMQEDRRALTDVTNTLSKQRVDANAYRNRDTNMKLETPEPVVGWSNYNTYVLNNIEIPEDLQNKPSSTGEVQVSFEVDKHGEPTNFKIEKSLCTKCDQEAIRLIKEGPKWKRNANKKGRTTVTIAF